MEYFICFKKFPKQICVEIFSFLKPKEILNVSLTCKFINSLINHSKYGNALWKIVFFFHCSLKRFIKNLFFSLFSSVGQHKSWIY